MNDVRTLPADQAADSVRNRFRLDLTASGASDPQLLANTTDRKRRLPGGGLPADNLAAWQARLAADAVAPRPSVDRDGLRRALPDGLVERLARTTYTQQVRPGVPVEGDGVGSDAAGASAGLAANLRDGPVGSQTYPGRQSAVLDRCDTLFSSLPQTCGVQGGQRCETFSRAQFGEVAKITTSGGGVCSGTLIGERWVLSAAHCITPDSPADNARNGRGALTSKGDLTLTTEQVGRSFAVDFPHAAKLTRDRRDVESVIVHRNWSRTAKVAAGGLLPSGSVADYVYRADLALIRLTREHAVPLEAALPALIPKEDFSGLVTTAGYGFTTVENGAAGQLWVTWPTPPVLSTHGQLELLFSGGGLVSTFCRGDSGGPAFAGRHRGCAAETRSAKVEAPRPRPLVGVTSYYYGQSSDTVDALTSAHYCMNAPVMRFVNVTAPDYRGWICEMTGNEADSCR